jgi:GH15 family glucan-1,4-alpha-glucosidase
VLITRFFAQDGVGEIQDFMPVRGPAEAQRHQLIRRVLCVRGTMPFRARVSPRFGYGMDPHTLTEVEAGALFTASSLTVRLTATVPVEHDGRDVTAEFKLAEGESAVFALDEAGSQAMPGPCSGEEAEELLAATVTFWRNWLSASRYRGRWREVVHRSALTPKLLTYAPTGAIVAAPTTSLPEQVGRERNWDYRYVWVRDAAFCIYALLRLGFTSEADAFMHFMVTTVTASQASPAGPMQVMYGIDGRTEIPERELRHLAGYQGSRPVRIGNAAARQLQLDTYGELMDSVYLYDRWHQPISSAQWDAITTRADWLCDHWDQPDEGIWETRGGPKKFLYSQLMCWVAIERAVRLAIRRGLPADLERWRKARDAMYRRIMDRGWSPRMKAFTQDEGGDVLDAAVLAFEKMLTYASHLGLYAEQISRTGEQQGNFPQALTHLALISAAFNLDRALG